MQKMSSLIVALQYMVSDYADPESDGGLLTTSPSMEALEKSLESKYPGINSKLELTEYGSACSDIGFYNGFRLGMQLMAEACGTPIGKRVSW